MSTLLSRALDRLMPRAAARRVAADILRREYRAGRERTSEGGWSPVGSASPVAPALSLIRARARDLAHNNPFAARAVSTLVGHAVGRGILANVVSADLLESDWRAWASDPRRCDFYGRLPLTALQDLAVRTMIESGEVFIRLHYVRDRRGRLDLQLQIIDPDQIDDTVSRAATPDGEVVSGVETDADGRVVAYHFLRRRVNGVSLESVRVPAERVVHLYERLYPGQLRGIPRGAQALGHAKDLEDLIKATVVRAKIEACMSVFVTRAPDSGGGLFGAPEGGDGEPTGGAALDGELLEPGMIVRLDPGEDVKTSQPPSSGGLNDWSRLSLQAIAVSYGVTYDQLTSDLRGANFSSLRAGKIEFHRSIESLRRHAVYPGLDQIFRAFADAREHDLTAATWTWSAPAREAIDPIKDVQATRLDLALGLKTWRQAVAERGLDPEEQLAELREIKSDLAEAGLVFDYTGTTGPSPAGAAADETTE